MIGFLRLLGRLGVLAIAILSVAPLSPQARTGIGGGGEHVLAYAAVALCLLTGRAAREAVRTALALVALAGALEIAQLLVPGRRAEIAGFLASAGGTVLGAALGLFLTRRFPRFALEERPP